MKVVNIRIKNLMDNIMDYRGEVMATFRPTNPFQGKTYNIGDKLCQLIIVPAPEFELEEVDELSYTERGTKGHGEADNGK